MDGSTSDDSDIQLLVQIFDIYLSRLTLLPSNLLIHFNVEVDGISFSKSYSFACLNISHVQLTDETDASFQFPFQTKLNEFIKRSNAPQHLSFPTISEHLSFSNTLAVPRKLMPSGCPYLAHQKLLHNDPFCNHDISVAVTAFVLECKKITTDVKEFDHVPMPGSINSGTKDYTTDLSLIRYLNGMPLLDHDDDAAACVQSLALKAVNWLNYGCKLCNNQTASRKSFSTMDDNLINFDSSNSNERSHKNSDCDLERYLRSPAWCLQSLSPSQALKEGPIFHVVLLVDINHNSGKKIYIFTKNIFSNRFVFSAICKYA